MAFCGKCGGEVAAGAGFCPKCGEAQPGGAVAQTTQSTQSGMSENVAGSCAICWDGLRGLFSS